MVVMLTLFLNRYGVIAIPEIRCRLDLANAWKVGCIQPHISTMATVDDLVTKGVRLSVIGSFPRSIMCYVPLSSPLWRRQRRRHTYFGLYTRATEESCLLHRRSRVRKGENERKGRRK